MHPLHQGVHGPEEVVVTVQAQGGAVIADAQDHPGRRRAEPAAEGLDEGGLSGQRALFPFHGFPFLMGV